MAPSDRHVSGPAEPGPLREFTPAQRAGRDRMPCIGSRMGDRAPCDYAAVIELVVHEPGTEHRLIAPSCFAHALDIMHGLAAADVFDLYRYRLDRL